MTTVLIKHPIEDYSKWKNAFDAFLGFRKSGGEKSFHVSRPVDDPNTLVILFEWDSAENAMAFLDSAELKDAMLEAGVLGPPEITIMETATKGNT